MYADRTLYIVDASGAESRASRSRRYIPPSRTSILSGLSSASTALAYRSVTAVCRDISYWLLVARRDWLVNHRAAIAATLVTRLANFDQPDHLRALLTTRATHLRRFRTCGSARRPATVGLRRNDMVGYSTRFLPPEVTSPIMQVANRSRTGSGSNQARLHIRRNCPSVPAGLSKPNGPTALSVLPPRMIIGRARSEVLKLGFVRIDRVSVG